MQKLCRNCRAVQPRYLPAWTRLLRGCLSCALSSAESACFLLFGEEGDFQKFAKHLCAISLSFALCFNLLTPPKEAKAFVDPVTALSVASLVVTSYFFVTGLVARLQDPGSSQDFAESVVQLVKDTAGNQGVWGVDPATNQPWESDSLIQAIAKNTTTGGSGLIIASNWLANKLNNLVKYLIDEQGVNKETPVDVVQSGETGYSYTSPDGTVYQLTTGLTYNSSGYINRNINGNFLSLDSLSLGTLLEIPTDSSPDSPFQYRTTNGLFNISWRTQYGYRLLASTNPWNSSIHGYLSSSANYLSENLPSWFTYVLYDFGGDSFVIPAVIIDGRSAPSFGINSLFMTFITAAPSEFPVFNIRSSLSETHGNSLTMQEEEYTPVGALLNTQGIAIQTPSNSDSLEDIYSAVIGDASVGVLEPSDFAAEKVDTPVVDVPDDLSLWDYLKAIWQSILDIPKAIIDALVRVFVPSDTFIESIPEQLVAITAERVGILTYPANLTGAIISHIGEVSTSDPVLRWGDIREPFTNELLIASGEYPLRNAISNPTFHGMYDVYMIIMSGFVIFKFVEFLEKKGKELLGLGFVQIDN